MRHRSREEDHQIRISDLPAESSGRLEKCLDAAVVFCAQILVTPLHTFVSSEYYDAHLSLSFAAFLDAGCFMFSVYRTCPADVSCQSVSWLQLASANSLTEKKNVSVRY